MMNTRPDEIGGFKTVISASAVEQKCVAVLGFRIQKGLSPDGWLAGRLTGTVLSLRTTTSQKYGAVPRRARIQGS